MTEIASAWRTVECTWWLRFIVAAIAGAALGTSLLWIKDVLTIDYRAPVNMQRVESLNSPVPVGGKIVVRVWREKYRDDCPVVSSPYASDQNGRAYVMPGSQGPGGAKDEEYYDALYDVTALPPGSYTLHDSLMYHCPGQSFPVQQPPVSFVVAE
jgi:hypothetical protein